MTNKIIVSEDTILGEKHSGMRIVVEAPATITLPHEDTYKFIEGDENEIISAADGDVHIEGEEGVTVIPVVSATLTKRGSFVKTQYQGNNTYLIWGSLCVAIIVGISSLNSIMFHTKKPTKSPTLYNRVEIFNQTVTIDGGIINLGEYHGSKAITR